MNRQLRRLIKNSEGNKRSREKTATRIRCGNYIIRDGATLLTDEEHQKIEFQQLAILTKLRAGSFSEDCEVDLADHVNTILYAAEGRDPDIYKLCGEVIGELNKMQERYRKYDKWIITQPLVDILGAFHMAVFGDGGFFRRCTRSRLAKALERSYGVRQRMYDRHMEVWRRYSLLEWVHHCTSRARKRAFNVLGVRTRRRFYAVWEGRELEPL